MTTDRTPQLEDGYIRIATKLWEAWMQIRIPGQAEQVLKVIVRKTYGWGKKADVIPLSQFCEHTGMGKTHVRRALSKLVAMNIVTQKGNATY